MTQTLIGIGLGVAYCAGGMLAFILADNKIGRAMERCAGDSIWRCSLFFFTWPVVIPIALVIRLIQKKRGRTGAW